MSSPLGLTSSNRLGYIDQNRISLNTEAREAQNQAIAQAKAVEAERQRQEEEIRKQQEEEKARQQVRRGGKTPSWLKSTSKSTGSTSKDFTRTEQGRELIKEQEKTILDNLKKQAESQGLDISKVSLTSTVKDGQLVTEVKGIKGTVAGSTQTFKVDIDTGNLKLGKSRGTTPGEPITLQEQVRTNENTQPKVVGVDQQTGLLATDRGTVLARDAAGRLYETNARQVLPQDVKETRSIAGFVRNFDAQGKLTDARYYPEPSVRQIEARLKAENQAVIGASYRNEFGKVFSIDKSFFERPRVQGQPVQSESAPSEPFVDRNMNYFLGTKRIGNILTEEIAKGDKGLYGSRQVYDKQSVDEFITGYSRYLENKKTADDYVYFRPDERDPRHVEKLENKPGASKVVDGTRYTLQTDGMIKIESANRPPEYAPNIAEQLYSSTVGLGGQTAAGISELVNLVNKSVIGNEEASKGLENFASEARKQTSLQSLSTFYKGIGEVTGNKNYDFAAQHALDQSKAEIPAISPLAAGIGGLAGLAGIPEGKNTVSTFIEQTQKRPLQTLVTGAIDYFTIVRGAIGGVSDLIRGSKVSAIRPRFDYDTRYGSFADRASVRFNYRDPTRWENPEALAELRKFRMSIDAPKMAVIPLSTARTFEASQQVRTKNPTNIYSTKGGNLILEQKPMVNPQPVKSVEAKPVALQEYVKTVTNIPSKSIGLGGNANAYGSFGSLGFRGATGYGRKNRQPQTEDQYLRYPPGTNDIVKNLTNTISSINADLDQAVRQQTGLSNLQKGQSRLTSGLKNTPATIPFTAQITNPLITERTEQRTTPLTRTFPIQAPFTTQITIPIEIPTTVPDVPTIPSRPPPPTRTPPAELPVILPPWTEKKKKKTVGKDRNSIFTFTNYAPADILALTFGSGYTKRVSKRRREFLRYAD